MMRCVYQILIALMLACLGTAAAQQPQAEGTNATTEQASSQASSQTAVVDHIFSQEAKLVEGMHHYNPMVETYIQNLKPDPDLVTVPGSDKYFLGRLVLDEKGVRGKSFKDHNKSNF